MSEPEPLQEAPPPPEEPRRPLGGLIAGAVLAAVGVVWLLAATDALDLAAEVWIGALLVAVGVAIVAVPSGAGRGVLVAVGIVLAIAGAAATAVDVDLSGGIGDRQETPLSTAAAEDGYELGIGSLDIDLTQIGAQGGETTVEASVGIGELVVTVPEGVTVVVDAHAGIGDIQALGRQESGVDVDLERRFERGAGDDVLRLELDVGIGSIRVDEDATF